MAYKLDNFLVNVSSTDTKLHLRDGYGVTRWTVDAYDITSSFVNNNLLNIKLRSTDDIIILDFLSKYDAKAALKSLQQRLDALRVKTPINVDPELIKYIDSRQLSGPTGSQGPIGSTGPQGPIGYNGNYTTLTTNSNLVIIDTPSSFTFVTSSTSNDSIFTTESFDDSFGWYFKFTAPQINGTDEVNLSITSGSGDTYRFRLRSGNFQIRTVLGLVYTDGYSVGDVFSMYCDGYNVKYYINNNYLEQSSYLSGNYNFFGYPKTVDNPGSINNNSYTIADFKFYPTGKNGIIGIDGATGSVGATGSADRYTGTSSTPLQVPALEQYVTLQTQPNLSFTVLQDVIAVGLTAAYVFEYVDDYVEGDTAKYFIGQVDSYDTNTGELNLVVAYNQGYGLTDSSGIVPTYSFWYVNLSGKPGSGVSIDTPFNNALLTSDGTSNGVTVNQNIIFDGLTFSVYADVINNQLTQFQQTMEVFNFVTASSSIDLDFNLGSIWYIDTGSLSGDFAINIINVPILTNRIYTITLMINQSGGSAYLPNSFVIDGGSPITPLWANNSLPSGTVGNIDIIGLSFAFIGMGVTLIAQQSTYGS